jgi:hypothetical protein
MRRLPKVAVTALLLVSSSMSYGQGTAKKVESATGSVTGTVTCADTNAPARFAVVTLERVPGQKDEASDKAKRSRFEDGAGMNATATTDLEGHFVLEKVPVGRYFVVGILSGYMSPLSRFDHDDLQKMSEETQKELLKSVPTVSVEAGLVAQASIRLDHASELSGTVLYDDGSPAIHLKVRLLRKKKSGEIGSMDGILISGFGSEIDTDDRGRFRLIGVPPGEYSISASMHLEKIEFGGLVGSGGLSVNSSSDGGGEVTIYSGSKLRAKDAKVIKVGEGEQLGGLDITIPLAGLHTVRGMVTAKRDGHALNKGRVQLLYADDRKEAQYAELDREGNFVLPYVPEDKYILRATGGEDMELIQKHEFNSNFTEEKTLRKYGEVEIPLTVQAEMSAVELAVPDVAPKVVAQQ